MSQSALSSAQFGNAFKSQTPDPESVIPLPGSAQTYSSAQRATLWRSPKTALGQAATYGSFLNFDALKPPSE